MIGIILGGAECVWDEFGKTIDLCKGRNFQIAIANDMIGQFNGYADYGVTLHPPKLAGWLKNRQDKGFPKLDVIYSHRFAPGVTKTHKDWGGSVGLFSYQVLRANGFEKIIFCGVPMEPSYGHFVRNKKWDSAIGFRKKWEPRIREIKIYARSWSGWTAERLGKPDQLFIGPATC